MKRFSGFFIVIMTATAIQLAVERFGMSKQQAHAFIEKVNGDPALQQRVGQIADLAELMGFAEKVGYL